MILRLLKKKLIACANMFPIKTEYLWKGKIESCGEVVAILKTKKSNVEKVRKEIRYLHCYEIPCMLQIKISANEDYASWLLGELNK